MPVVDRPVAPGLKWNLRSSITTPEQPITLGDLDHSDSEDDSDYSVPQEPTSSQDSKEPEPNSPFSTASTDDHGADATSPDPVVHGEVALGSVLTSVGSSGGK